MSSVFGAGLAVLALVSAGCGRDEVSVTRVPAQPEKAAAPGMSGQMPPGHPGSPAPSTLPEPKWQAPQGWREVAASGMSVARFAVPGEKEGADADVAVMAFPGGGGHELDVINIFRERLRQEPLDEEGLKSVSREVAVGAEKGTLYDMAAAAGTNGVIRLLVAVLPQGPTSWYFRMIGSAGTVAREVPAFEGWLKTVSFEAAPAPVDAPSEPSAAAAPALPAVPSAPATKAAPGAPGKPEYEVPAGWKEESPTPMVTSRFTVARDGGKAEVAVSSFPGDVGGLVANVNRWRGQVGLPPLGEAEVKSSLQSIEVQGAQVSMVDMLGERGGSKTRLVGLIVPRGDRTWFYKMTGDDGLVAGEKENLVKLARSAKLP